MRTVLTVGAVDVSAWLPPGWRATLDPAEPADLVLVGPDVVDPVRAVYRHAGSRDLDAVVVRAADHDEVAASFAVAAFSEREVDVGTVAEAAIVATNAALRVQLSRAAAPDPTAPWRDADAVADMRAFRAALDPVRDEVDRRVAAHVLEMPEFLPLLSAWDPAVSDARNAASRALMDAAIEQGEWEPYLANLRAEGAAYARIGLTFSSWFGILRVFRETLRDLAPDMGPSAERGMATFIDLAMTAIAAGHRAHEEAIVKRVQRRSAVHAAVVDSSPDPVIVLDRRGLIVGWSPGAATTLQAGPDAVMGLPITPFVHADDRTRFLSMMDDADPTRPTRNVPVRLQTASGDVVDALVSLAPLTSDEGGLLGVALLVRDLREELARARAHAAVLEGALDAILTLDGSGRCVEANASARALFAPGTLEGLQVTHILPGMPALDALAGRRVEVTARRRDGTTFPAEVAVVHAEVAGASHTTAFVRDLTAEHQARRRLEHTVRTLERSNENLEQFAYVASHDLQEPLRMVTAYMSLLREDHSDRLPADARDCVDFAFEGAVRMKQLVDSLLAYSRVETRGGEFVSVDLAEIAREVVADLTVALARTEGEVVIGDLPTVRGDAVQIRQVLQNLLANSLKFHGDSPPRITLEAAATEDGMWRVVVDDNGIGFDPRHAGRVFGMFERLHERSRYPGNGIGLAVARRIVERHGGRIWADSQPGRGATFRFTLPAGGEPAPEA